MLSAGDNGNNTRRGDDDIHVRQKQRKRVRREHDQDSLVIYERNRDHADQPGSLTSRILERRRQAAVA